MVTDFPIQSILNHLVLRIVNVLPITAAGVTLISPGSDPRYVAASSPSALRFEQLQTALGEGPCIAAYQTGEAVTVPDLRVEDRFPRFAPRALAAGLVAVFTFPLRKGDTQLGALDLYRDAPGPLDPGTLTAAQTLADVAAAYLLNAQARAALEASSGRAREMSLHDALTGLPNRTLLLERISHALQRRRRSSGVLALLFADLDQFKLINDMHGHRIGDKLLVAVARRLTQQLRPGDTLARFSGDEFVILCEDAATESEVSGIAARIGAAIAKPFVISGTEVGTSASIGVALASDDADLPEQLLHNADMAMYQAKRSGGARHQTIDVDEQTRTDERALLQRDVRHACERDELRLDYQPIANAVDARIVAVEALVRWSHPSLGTILQNTVIPLAERFGTLPDIGRWVLTQACSDLRGWREHHEVGDVGMCVGVSPHQLLSADFATSVDEVLHQTHIDARLLTLEVNESIFIRDGERAVIVLDELRGLGVRTALDDFGSGYSSLAFLKRFRGDILKVDSWLVADLGGDDPTEAVVSAVVQLAHKLGLAVTAKGVETQLQFERAAALGCDACQGHHVSPPMPAAEVATLLSHTLPDTRAPRPSIARRG